MKKVLAMILVLCMVLSLGVTAFASGEPSGEASGEVDVEAAYLDYIHEFLLAELEVNANMTIEQIEDEYMPLFEAKDYETTPADLLFNGMLENGVAMNFEEFAAQYVPAAAGGTDEAAYKAYLKEFADAIPAIQDNIDEFYAAIDAGTYDAFPADMLFNAELLFFGYVAMSYDEFVAAGGAYEIPAFDPNMVAD